MKDRNNTYGEIAEKIRQYQRIFITTHRNPEGDAIGSSLALYHVFSQQGKNIRFSLDDDVPHPLDLLPLAEKAEKNIYPDDDELVIVVDCPNLQRINSPFASMNRRHGVINLDHHLENSYFGELNYVDSEACATGELIYFLLQEFGDTFDNETSTFLYMAILTDTGSFRFANTNYNAFMISYQLVRQGLNPHSVSQLVYENYSLSKMKLLGYALSHLNISDDGKIGWISVTQDVLKKFNSRSNDMEGFVNYPRFIEGVIVSIFFYEIGQGKTKVSLRSKGLANVAEFAKEWGGGGHKNAAACVVEGPIEAVKDEILGKLLPEMSRSGLRYD